MPETLIESNELPVRYEVEGEVIDIGKVNRLVRRFLASQTKKMRKKFEHLEGRRDEHGRSATLVIRLPKRGQLSVECVIEYPEAFGDEIDGSDKAVRLS